MASASQKLADAEILVLFPNKTWNYAKSDWRGEANLNLHSDHLPMTVFAAKAGVRALVAEGWIPRDGDLSVDLEPLPGGGSVIFRESYGELPGLLGSLTPIRAQLDRTYLFSSNIAINCGLQQPLSFSFNEEIRLTDSEGRELLVRIANVFGRSSILEYRQVPDDNERA